MKFLLNIFSFALLISCSTSQTDKQNGKSTPSFPRLEVRYANFPLSLTNINFHDNKNIEKSNGDIEAKLNETIQNIYYNDYGGDSSQTYFSIKDIYIGTLKLQDSLYSIFMVIFKHIPGGLDSKILFYDMHTKKFADSTPDFNINGLYDFDNLKLKPTNLKEELKIMTPEIELVDFDKDGVNDYKFTRLYHNGTANAGNWILYKVNKV